MTFTEASLKTKLSQPPPIGEENFQYLITVGEQGNMCSFKDVLRWNKDKVNVQMLESMQKMVDFQHNKSIEMLKLRYLLPNLASLCLHKSTAANFYLFTERNKELLEKICEDMVGGPSIVLTRKAVADKTLIRDSRNWF